MKWWNLLWSVRCWVRKISAGSAISLQIGSKDRTKLELAASNFHISHNIHASADIYGGAESTTLRCRKRHACHTKSRGVKYVPLRRQASADIYGGTESTTPATQSEPEVLKVSRLPHKKPRRQICPLSSPSFRWHLWRCRKYHPEVPKASRLPHKKPWRQICPPSSPSLRWHLWRYRKYHACHAKWAWSAESVTPATQKAAASNMSPFVAKLPLTSMEVPKVPRLPRKVSLKCWKCHACHTKSRGVKYVPLRRQASTDIYGGTESTTPATQSEPEVLKASRLPHKKPRRQICPPSSPSFRGHLWRY